MCKMRVYKRYGKNETDVKYNFKMEFPNKIILNVKVDKTYKPKLSSTKNKESKKRYLIKAKDG